MRASLVLALVLLAPAASALDALSDAQMGATEARVLVRLPDGGALRVDAGPGARAAIAPPDGDPGEFAPVPASFAVPVEPADRAWHGLPGTVAVVVVRASPSDAMEILVSDERGGAAFEWAARPPRGVSEGGTVLALLALGAMALVRFRKRRSLGDLVGLADGLPFKDAVDAKRGEQRGKR